MATVNLALTTIQAAQAQKEVTANGNFDIIDKSQAQTSQALVNGTNNLTEAVCQYDTVVLTGALTLAATVVVPATLLKQVRFINKTTGHQTVTVKHSGQTGVTLKYNEQVLLYPTMAQGDGQRRSYKRKSVAMTDANYTASEDDASSDSIEATGTLTAGRNFVVPAVATPLTFYNNTTGGFAVTVKTPSGSGIAVAAGKRAMLECDGTNVVRITADQ